MRRRVTDRPTLSGATVSGATLSGATAAGVVAAVVVAALALTGCGGGSSSASGPRTSGSTVVDTRQVGGLGPVLTTSTGQTLYMFPPDAERHVTCVATCAATWPPLTVATGSRASAGPGVQASLLGSDPDPAGGPAVVTYDGWPLYTYQDDLRPGQVGGQALDLDGGFWYVIAPTGQPITVSGATKQPAGGTPPTTAATPPTS